jgi:hypothetical protein
MQGRKQQVTECLIKAKGGKHQIRFAMTVGVTLNMLRVVAT